MSGLLVAWRTVSIGIAAFVGTEQISAQRSEVDREIEASDAFLRKLWPEVGPVTIDDGNKVQFRDGKIVIGVPELERLTEAADAQERALLRRFILGHEYWHSVQARRLSPSELATLRQGRVLECEADFMGAFAVAKSLTEVDGQDLAEIDRRLEAIGDYLDRQPPASSNMNYPPSANRARTARLAMALARRPDVFERVERWRAADSATIGRDVCHLVAQSGDGASGSVVFSALSGKGQGGAADIAEISYRNYSSREITATYAVVADWWSAESGAKAIVDVQVGELVLPANGQGTHQVVIAVPPEAKKHGLLDVWPILVSSMIKDQGLATLRFNPVTERASQPCYTRLVKEAEPQDRQAFKNLAIVALAARDNFRSVRSATFEAGGAGERTYRYANNLGATATDGIRTLPSGLTWATLTPHEGEDEEKILADFKRLSATIRRHCPGTAAEETDEDGDLSLELSNFAPAVAIGMRYHRFSKDKPLMASDQAFSAGTVTFYISPVVAQD